MTNDYLVIGWGFSKKDGSPYSRCAQIVSDTKEGKYQFIDFEKDKLLYLDHHEPLGTIVKAELKITK